MCTPLQFGGCLALRVALAAPDLIERMVLVNPATCFARSLGGLAGAIAATNLLSLFPAPLYEVRARCRGNTPNLTLNSTLTLTLTTSCKGQGQD